MPVNHGKMHYPPLSDTVRFLLNALGNKGITDGLSDRVDWSKLEHLIAHHRLESYIYQQAGFKDSKTLPKHIKTGIEQVHNRNVYRSLLYQSTLGSIFSAFESSGVEAMLVKGVAAQMWLYGQQIRPARDIDILVAQETVGVAERCLRRLGFSALYCKVPFDPQKKLSKYRQKWFKDQSYYNAEIDVTVELHWRLTNVVQAFPLSFNDVWRERSLIVVADRQIPALPDAVHGVYLCVHASLLIYGRMFSLVDIALIITQNRDLLDAMFDEAYKLKSERYVGCAIIMACELFSLTLPSALLQRRALYSLCRALIESILPDVLRDSPERPRSPESKSSIAYQAKIVNWNAKISSIHGHGLHQILFLMAPKYQDLSFVNLPDSLSQLYWVVRPYRLLSKQ